MDANWYAVFSKPHKETQVASYLHSKGIEVYHPTLRVKPVNPRSAKIRPYFPRYLFVHTDLDALGAGTLQWAPGAVGLVSFGGEPAIVPTRFISALRSRMADIETAGGLALEGLKHGDPVTITHGPFEGYEAIFDMRLNGEERVQVLLHWLGREMKVQISAHTVAKRKHG